MNKSLPPSRRASKITAFFATLQTDVRRSTGLHHQGPRFSSRRRQQKLSSVVNIVCLDWKWQNVNKKALLLITHYPSTAALCLCCLLSAVLCQKTPTSHSLSKHPDLTGPRPVRPLNTARQQEESTMPFTGLLQAPRSLILVAPVADLGGPAANKIVRVSHDKNRSTTYKVVSFDKTVPSAFFSSLE